MVFESGPVAPAPESEREIFAKQVAGLIRQRDHLDMRLTESQTARHDLFHENAGLRGELRKAREQPTWRYGTEYVEKLQQQCDEATVGKRSAEIEADRLRGVLAKTELDANRFLAQERGERERQENLVELAKQDTKDAQRVIERAKDAFPQRSPSHLFLVDKINALVRDHDHWKSLANWADNQIIPSLKGQVEGLAAERDQLQARVDALLAQEKPKPDMYIHIAGVCKCDKATGPHVHIPMEKPQ